MRRWINAIKDEIEIWPIPFLWSEIIGGVVILTLVVLGVWGFVKIVIQIFRCGG